MRHNPALDSLMSYALTAMINLARDACTTIALHGNNRHAAVCVTCHDVHGEDMLANGFHGLAEPNAGYLQMQLDAFEKGQRANAMMAPVTEIISGVGVGLAEMPATGPCHTKKQTHRVVFEVNVDGAEQWQGILNNVENLQKSFGSGTSELEVVAHGKGLGLILKINESMRERLQLVSGAGVCFAACENTMRRMNLKLEDLMPFATTVDSGVAEVVRKQEAGWSYIKSGS